MEAATKETISKKPKIRLQFGDDYKFVQSVAIS